MEKISIPWRTVKDTRNSSLLKKIKFWEDGIMKLPEKWQKVVEQNGEYVVLGEHGVLGENEKCLLFLTQKLKDIF